ncbi:hypothetical protein FACS1894214_3490 [Planctomycetales bacterium]|nr:hypothetical protein FACS1894214_3490 [Planctomycetales bacterium]
MIDVLIKVLIAGVASWAVVDLLHHSYITGWIRAVVNKLPLNTALYVGTHCPYCYGFWVSAVCVFAMLGQIPLTLFEWGAYVIMVFAAWKLSNILNDKFRWRENAEFKNEPSVVNHNQRLRGWRPPLKRPATEVPKKPTVK